MTSPRDYTASQLASGALTADHVSELARHWQATHGLAADGMPGPATVRSIEQALGTIVVVDHLLVGPGVEQIASDPSWYGGPLTGARPGGIVVHTSATDHGTAQAMARRRTRPRAKGDRVASWHLSIDGDGRVVQQVPLHRQAWHAGSDTAVPVPGLGWANARTVGIELVGHGREFPPAQVAAARTVWRAIVRAYGIPREHAMISHASIDPARRSDPGPVWIAEHAQAVLDAAYG